MSVRETRSGYSFLRPTGSAVTSISAAAVAAAEAEAQAAELERRAARSRRPYYLSNYLRKNGSTSPASSDSTCSSANRITARPPGVDTRRHWAKKHT